MKSVLAVAIFILFGISSFGSVPVCQAQFKDTTVVIDSSIHKSVVDSVGMLSVKLPPLKLWKVGLQFIAGHAAFAAIFWGLSGKNFIRNDQKDSLAFGGALSWLAAVLGSSVAVNGVGNLLGARDGSFWHTLFGGLVIGVGLQGAFAAYAPQLFNNSQATRYVVVSSMPIAAEILLYYLWPALPDSSGSDQNVKLAPYHSGQETGLHLVIPLR